MMYQITYIHKDSTTENDLYIPGDETYSLTEAKLSLGAGLSGELSISIPDTNPAKSDIVCLTDEVIFYRDGEELWRGRPVTWQLDFDLTGTLTCEGVLSYLYDTWYPPYDFSGSPTDFIQSILDNHNSQVEERKQIQLGNITVTDNNDYIARSATDYTRSFEVLSDKLVNESLGGYLRVRREKGLNYLDYLESYNTTASQVIQLGVNILDIADTVEYGDVITALIPLGAQDEETGEYLTVEEVNDGSIFVSDEDAVEEYGWIVGCATWDDVTLASNLLTKAKAYLAQSIAGVRTVEVSAIDLTLAGEDVTALNIGDMVNVSSSPHGIDLWIMLSEMEIDPLDPENDMMTFGATTASYTGTAQTTERQLLEQISESVTTIRNLQANTVTTSYLAANYAAIDLLNVTSESVGTLLAKVGLITDLTVEDASITGVLNGVTINADVITAGTLSVDRLLITGEDSIVYQINATSAGLTETELTDEVYQSYLNGTTIVANSITATQIAAGTITANELAANSVTSSQITSGAVTAEKIDVAQLSAITANIGTLVIDDYLTTNTERTVYNQATTGMTIDSNGIGGWGSSTQWWTMTTGGDLVANGATFGDLTIASGTDHNLGNCQMSFCIDDTLYGYIRSEKGGNLPAFYIYGSGSVYVNALAIGTGDSVSRPSVLINDDDTGILSVSEGLAVTGTATISKTLDVTGETTLTSLTATSAIYANSTLQFGNYGTTARWATTFGYAGIASGSSGSDLYLYTLLSGSSSWSDSKVIANSSGVRVIVRSDPTSAVGSSSAPVYISSSGVATKCGSLDVNVTNSASGTGVPVITSATDGYKVATLACRAQATATTYRTGYYIALSAQWGTTGSTYATQSIYSAASDIRLKDNVSACETDAMAVIRAIPVRQFDWRESGIHQEIGFVADELEAISPNFASGGGYDEDGNMFIKTVNTFYMMGYVVKGMQEMDDDIVALKAEITKLKAQIAAMAA